MKGPVAVMEQCNAHHPEASNELFSDFIWMGEEEDFDQKFEEELEEEEFMEACMEEMLQEEESDVFIPGESSDNDESEHKTANTNGESEQPPVTNGSTEKVVAETPPDS